MVDKNKNKHDPRHQQPAQADPIRLHPIAGASGAVVGLAGGLAVGLGVAGMAVHRCSTEDAALRTFTDPNEPKATAPADVESVPPADMEKVKQAVEDAKQKTGKADGASGATRTSERPADVIPVAVSNPVSFVDKLSNPQETPAEKAAREAAYLKAVNDGLKVTRSPELIEQDKKIAKKFADMFSQDPQYKDVSQADIESAVLNGYYKTIDQWVAEENILGLDRLAKGDRATPEQLRDYFAGIEKDPARKAAYEKQVVSAIDTAGRYGMNSIGAITANLANRSRQSSGRGY